MVDAQKWLDEKYPKNQRGEVKELRICNKNLENSLDLSDFVSLEKLSCYVNKITSLNISNCPELIYLDAGDNSLASLDLSKNLKLEKLYIWNNNFSEQDLSFLSHLVNLKILCLGNRNSEQIKENNYNHFGGSLENLQNLTNLKRLNIDNTDVDSGLEYLPKSVKIFDCLSDIRENAKVKKIYQELKGKLITERKKDWEKEKDKLLSRVQDIQKDVDQFFSGYSSQEVSKLKNPDELGKYKYYIGIPQWSGRVASVIGGSLLFVGAGDANSDYTRVGGVIAIVAPFIEAVSGYYEKRHYEVNENKWDRFVTDSKQLWNDYQELTRVSEPFKPFEISWDSEWAKKFQKIKEIIDRFPKEKNSKGEIVLATKNQFAQDLQRNWENRKEWWEEIGEILARLSKEQHSELINDNINQTEAGHQAIVTSSNQQSQNKEHHVIKLDDDVVVDLEEYFAKKTKLEQEQVKSEELINQVEVPTEGI